MKQLMIQQAEQATAYRYQGLVGFKEIAEMMKDYPFDPEVIDKAEIHKENFMQYGNSTDSLMVPPVSITLRVDPDAEIEKSDEEIKFNFENFDIVDGRSKVAAITLLDEKWLESNSAKIELYVLDKAKMDQLF